MTMPLLPVESPESHSSTVAMENSPELALRAAIDNSMDQKTARLIYADWCEENNRETLALVQRWLAATGRSPGPVMHLGLAVTRNVPWGRATYWRNEADHNHIALRQHILPEGLFRCLPDRKDQTAIYPSAAAAEDALCEAWQTATRGGWFRRSWTPDFKVVEAGIRFPDPAPETSGNMSTRAGFFFVFFLFAVVLRVVSGINTSEPVTKPVTPPFPKPAGLEFKMPEFPNPVDPAARMADLEKILKTLNHASFPNNPAADKCWTKLLSILEENCWIVKVTDSPGILSPRLWRICLTNPDSKEFLGLGTTREAARTSLVLDLLKEPSLPEEARASLLEGFPEYRWWAEYAKEPNVEESKK